MIKLGQRLSQFDIGVPIEIPCHRDLTGASVTYEFQPPGAEPWEAPASIVEQATGVTRFLTRAGDVAQYGLWLVQAHVVGPGNADWRTATLQFEVDAIIGPLPIFLYPGVAGVHAYAPNVAV